MVLEDSHMVTNNRLDGFPIFWNPDCQPPLQWRWCRTEYASPRSLLCFSFKPVNWRVLPPGQLLVSWWALRFVLQPRVIKTAWNGLKWARRRRAGARRGAFQTLGNVKMQFGLRGMFLSDKQRSSWHHFRRTHQGTLAERFYWAFNFQHRLQLNWFKFWLF